MLDFTRLGTGPTLLLLHPLGSARHSWDPVVPILADRFDVIALDLPGFGRSEPVPTNIEPTPVVLATIIAGLLDDLGVATPHVAGNSLGGWVALELARRRRVRSLTLLSPAGLWRNDTPRYSLISLRVTRWLARYATAALSRLVATRIGRGVVLGQTHGRPASLTAQQARAAIDAMASCPGFDATLAATTSRRYVAAGPIDAPITVAFGSRDLLLLRRSRYLDELPSHAHLAALRHCGHIPMYDNPRAVAALIIATAGRAETE